MAKVIQGDPLQRKTYDRYESDWDVNAARNWELTVTKQIDIEGRLTAIELGGIGGGSGGGGATWANELLADGDAVGLGTTTTQRYLDELAANLGVSLVEADIRYARRSRVLTAGTGLIGGGTLDADRTFALTGQALAFHEFASTGLFVRTAGGDIVPRQLAGTANQIIVANPTGATGNPTISLPQNIHTAATPTFAQVHLSAQATAETHALRASRAIDTENGLTGGGTLQTDLTLGLTGQALAFHNLATAGYVVRTGADTVTARTLRGTTNQVSVSNGAGLGGDPTFSLPQDIHTAANPTFHDLTLSGRLYVDAVSEFYADTRHFGDAVPGTHWGSDLGALGREWRRLRVGEVIAAVLVAEEHIATTGGVWYVGDGNALAAPMTPTDNTVTLQYNNYSTGDWVILRDQNEIGLPQTEVLQITSTYTPTTVDGEPAFVYTVDRQTELPTLPFSEKNWPAGSATFTTGSAAGTGWIEAYATRSYVTNDTTDGPAMVFWNRTGTAWDDTAPHAAVGNLHGHYHYGTDVYGAVFGTPSGDYVAIDENDGVSFYAAGALAGYVRADGFRIGSGTSYVHFDPAGGVLDIQIGGSAAATASSVGQAIASYDATVTGTYARIDSLASYEFVDGLAQTRTLAGYTSYVDATFAKADLFASYTWEDFEGTQRSLATYTAYADGTYAQITSLASYPFDDGNSGQETLAGLTARASALEAQVVLTAEAGGSLAYIDLLGNPATGSQITIGADQIDIEGITSFVSGGAFFDGFAVGSDASAKWTNAGGTVVYTSTGVYVTGDNASRGLGLYSTARGFRSAAVSAEWDVSVGSPVTTATVNTSVGLGPEGMTTTALVDTAHSVVLTPSAFAVYEGDTLITTYPGPTPDAQYRLRVIAVPAGGAIWACYKNGSSVPEWSLTTESAPAAQTAARLRAYVGSHTGASVPQWRVRSVALGDVRDLGATVIHGDRILTGSVLADRIQTTTLSAIVADLGSVTAGEIVLTDPGALNKLWFNHAGDGGIAVGGLMKSTAPFRLSKDGQLYAIGVEIEGVFTATTLEAENAVIEGIVTAGSARFGDLGTVNGLELTAGTDYWYDTGELKVGGESGIYSAPAGAGIELRSNVVVAGDLVVTGLLQAGDFDYGGGLGGDGLELDAFNYWYDTGAMRVGSATRYFAFDPVGGTLVVEGDLRARSGWLENVEFRTGLTSQALDGSGNPFFEIDGTTGLVSIRRGGFVMGDQAPMSGHAQVDDGRPWGRYEFEVDDSGNAWAHHLNVISVLGSSASPATRYGLSIWDHDGSRASDPQEWITYVDPIADAFVDGSGDTWADKVSAQEKADYIWEQRFDGMLYRLQVQNPWAYDKPASQTHGNGFGGHVLSVTMGGDLWPVGSLYLPPKALPSEARTGMVWTDAAGRPRFYHNGVWRYLDLGNDPTETIAVAWESVSARPTITLTGDVTDADISLANDADFNVALSVTKLQRAVTAGAGLTGGGTLTSDVSVALTGQALALHNLATSGLIVRTGAGAVTARTIVSTSAALVVSNGTGVSGNPSLALDADLTALAALGATGFAVRTASDTWAQRTLSSTGNGLTVTDGTGVAGSPVFSLAQDIRTTATPTFAQLLLSGPATASTHAVRADRTLTVTGLRGVLVDSGASSAKTLTSDPTWTIDTPQDLRTTAAVQHASLGLGVAPEAGFALKAGKAVLTDALITRSTGTAIGSEAFESGFGGHGFRIAKDGTSWDGELDNLTVRGTFSVYHLLAREIDAVGGSFFFAPRVTVRSATDNGDGTWTLLTEESVPPVGVGTGQYLLGQMATTDYTSVTQSKVKVTAKTNGTGGGPGSLTVTKVGTTGDPLAGMVMVRYDHDTAANQRGHVYVTASDSGAPYLTVRQTDGTGVWPNPNTESLRLGKLDGWGTAFANQNVFGLAVGSTGGGHTTFSAEASRGADTGGVEFWTGAVLAGYVRGDAFHIGDGTQYFEYDSNLNTATLVGSMTILNPQDITTSSLTHNAGWTVGATWGTDLNNIPGTLQSPSGDGLYLSSTNFGFYKSSQWKTYMDSTGAFFLDGQSGTDSLSWNSVLGQLTIRGTVLLPSSASVSDDPFFSNRGYWSDTDTPELTAVSTQSGVAFVTGGDLWAGGTAARLTGAGTALFSRRAVAVDTSKAYRARVRVRKLTDGATRGNLYVGFVCLDENYAQITENPGTHRYFIVGPHDLKAVDGWQVFEGTIQGEGASQGHGLFKTGTKYVRVVILANHQGSSDAVTEVDSLEVFEATEIGDLGNTLIEAGRIATGLVVADSIQVTNLAAINADMGSITAGQIVVGSTDKLWLNDGSDGRLAVGGSVKGDAPFYVDADGTLRIQKEDGKIYLGSQAAGTRVAGRPEGRYEFEVDDGKLWAKHLSTVSVIEGESTATRYGLSIWDHDGSLNTDVQEWIVYHDPPSQTGWDGNAQTATKANFFLNQRRTGSILRFQFQDPNEYRFGNDGFDDGGTGDDIDFGGIAMSLTMDGDLILPGHVVVGDSAWTASRLEGEIRYAGGRFQGYSATGWVDLDRGNVPGDGAAALWSNVTSRPTINFTSQATGTVDLSAIADNASVDVDLTVHDSDKLDGQHGSYYQNATNLTSGTINDARIPTNIVRDTRALTAGAGIAALGDLSANRTVALTGQALALHNLGSSGLVARTASGVVAARTLVSTSAALVVTNGSGVSGNPSLALDADLQALADLASTGIAARTGTNTWAQRTLVSTGNGITITNGSGASGNPTFAAAQDIRPTAVPTFEAYKIPDRRDTGAGGANVDLTPDEYAEQAMSLGFTDETPHPSLYASTLTMKGWTSTYASWQLLGSAADSSGDHNLYFRTGEDSSWNTLQKVWTDFNDGAGSGLDADLWDGNQFASYLNQAVRTTDSVFFGSLDVSGTSALDGLITVETGIRSNDFLAGFEGDGMELVKDGANWRIEADELTVRGSFYVYELVAREISAVNGNLYVSANNEVTEVSGAGPYVCTVKGKVGLTVGSFVKGQILAADFASNSVFTGKVTATNVGAGTITVAATSGVPVVGMTLARTDHETNADERGALYFATSDSYAPYMAVLQGDGANASAQTLRIGRMEGISNWAGSDAHGFWAGETAGDAITITPSGSRGANTGGVEFWDDTDVVGYLRGGALRVGDDTEYVEFLNGGLTLVGQATVKGGSAVVPSGAGLYLGSDYMGFHSGTTWTSYIKSDGAFQFKGNATNLVSWDGTTFNIKATTFDLSATSGGDGVKLDNTRLALGGATSVTVGDGVWAGSNGDFRAGTADEYLRWTAAGLVMLAKRGNMKFGSQAALPAGRSYDVDHPFQRYDYELGSDGRVWSKHLTAISALDNTATRYGLSIWDHQGTGYASDPVEWIQFIDPVAQTFGGDTWSDAWSPQERADYIWDQRFTGGLFRLQFQDPFAYGVKPAGKPSGLFGGVVLSVTMGGDLIPTGSIVLGPKGLPSEPQPGMLWVDASSRPRMYVDATDGWIYLDLGNKVDDEIAINWASVSERPDLDLSGDVSGTIILDNSGSPISTSVTVNAVQRSVLSGTGLTGGGVLTSNQTLSLTGQALALHNLSTSGLIARTGSGTVAGRTLTATANLGLTLTDGNGVSGNPTFTLAQDIRTTATPQFPAVKLGTHGRLTGENGELAVRSYDGSNYGSLTVLDLNVVGQINSTTTSILEVEDSYIKVNRGATGAPILNAGLRVERGTSADADMVWDEGLDRWGEYLTGGTFKPFLTGDRAETVAGAWTFSDTLAAADLTVAGVLDAYNNLDGHKIGRLVINYSSDGEPELLSGGDHIRFGSSIMLSSSTSNVVARSTKANDVFFSHQRSGDYGFSFRTKAADGSTDTTRLRVGGGADQALVEIRDADFSVDGQVILASGTVGAPSLAFAGDTDTGIYRSTTNTMGLVASGVERITVNTNGVGITQVDPQASLHVSGTLLVNNHAGVTYSTVAIGDMSRPSAVLVNRNVDGYRGGLLVYTSGDSYGTTLASRGDSGSLLSAGAAHWAGMPSTATFKYHATTASSFVQDSGAFRFMSGTGLTIGAIGALTERVTIEANGDVTSVGTIEGQTVRTDRIMMTDNLYPTQDGVRDLGGVATQWANVYSVNGSFSGNVGIGTAAPTEKLHVVGTRMQVNNIKLGEIASGDIDLIASAGTGGLYITASNNKTITLREGGDSVATFGTAQQTSVFHGAVTADTTLSVSDALTVGLRSEWTRTGSYSVSTPYTLVRADGSALSQTCRYRVRAWTTGTGSDTGGVWLVRYEPDGTPAWKVRTVSVSGDASNNPTMYVDTDGLVKLATFHATSYGFGIAVEEIDTLDSDTVDDLWGADVMWQAVAGDLSYVGGDVYVGAGFSVGGDTNLGDAADKLTLNNGNGAGDFIDARVGGGVRWLNLETAGGAGFRVDNTGNVIKLLTKGQPFHIQPESGGNNAFQVKGYYSASVPLSVDGMAGQTGDLQQWRDSAGAALSVVDAAGWIGVNTADPLAPLHVTRTGYGAGVIIESGAYTTTALDLKINGTTVGAWAYTGQVQAWQGSAGAPGLSFYGDTNTGVFSYTTDTLNFGTGGADRMKIDPSGNVSIGLPSQTSSVARLHVAGTGVNELALDALTGSPDMIFAVAGNTRAQLVYQDDESEFVIRTNTSATGIIGLADSTERLKIAAGTGNATFTADLTADGVLSTGTRVVLPEDGVVRWNNDSSQANLIGYDRYAKTLVETPGAWLPNSFSWAFTENTDAESPEVAYGGVLTYKQHTSSTNAAFQLWSSYNGTDQLYYRWSDHNDADFGAWQTLVTAKGGTNGKIDTDAYAKIGRAQVGYTGISDLAQFAHIDQATTTGYALSQAPDGVTYLNAASGQDIRFRTGNVARARLSATGLRIGDESAAAEALHVAGNSLFSGILSSEAFTSGFAGNGWRYGLDAETDNLTIRGTMRVYELLINQIRSTNGSVLVSSNGKVKSVSGSGPYTLTFDTTDGLGHGFLPGDIIRAQRFNPDFTSLVLSDLKVTAVAGFASLTATLISGAVPLADYEYVRLGNDGTTANRQGTVYMSADDSGAPFIDITDGVASHADWNTPGVVKSRMGRLDGITSATFGVLDGYGGWFGNMYAEGNVQIAGSLTAGDADGVGTTFYAGRTMVNYVGNSIFRESDFYGGSYNAVGNQALKWSTTPYIDNDNRLTFGVADKFGGNEAIEFTTSAAPGTGEYLIQSGKTGVDLQNKTITYSAWVKADASANVKFGFAGFTEDTLSVGTEWTLLVKTINTGTYASFLDTSTAWKWLIRFTNSNTTYTIAHPQVVIGDKVKQYQPTTEGYATSDVTYGMWARNGGFGGDIRNPIVEITDQGISIGDDTRIGDLVDAPSTQWPALSGRGIWTQQGFFEAADGSYMSFDGALELSTPNLTIDAGGNVTMDGTVTAADGLIGGWTINPTNLTGGNSVLAASGNLTLGSLFAYNAAAGNLTLGVVGAGLANVVLNGTTLVFRDNATTVGSLSGTSWTLGQATSTNKNISITSGALSLREGTTDYVKLTGSALTVGVTGQAQMTVDSSKLQFDVAGDIKTRVNATGFALFRKDGASTVRTAAEFLADGLRIYAANTTASGNTLVASYLEGGITLYDDAGDSMTRITGGTVSLGDVAGAHVDIDSTLGADFFDGSNAKRLALSTTGVYVGKDTTDGQVRVLPGVIEVHRSGVRSFIHNLNGTFMGHFGDATADQHYIHTSVAGALSLRVAAKDRVVLNAEALTFYDADGTTANASFSGTLTRIGRVTMNRVEVTDSEVRMYDDAGNTEWFKLAGGAMRIGPEASAHSTQTATGITLYSTASLKAAEFLNSGTNLYGQNGVLRLQASTAGVYLKSSDASFNQAEFTTTGVTLRDAAGSTRATFLASGVTLGKPGEARTEITDTELSVYDGAATPKRRVHLDTTGLTLGYVAAGDENLHLSSAGILFRDHTTTRGSLSGDTWVLGTAGSSQVTIAPTTVTTGLANGVRSVLNATGLTTYTTSTLKAAEFLTTGTTFYDTTGSPRAALNTTGLTLYDSDGTTPVAAFGADITIGVTTEPHFYANSSLIRIGDASGARLQANGSDVRLFDAGGSKTVQVSGTGTVQIGRVEPGYENLFLKAAGMEFREDTVVRGSLSGDTWVLGTAGSSQVTITPSLVVTGLSGGVRSELGSTGLTLFTGASTKAAEFKTTGTFLYDETGTAPLTSLVAGTLTLGATGTEHLSVTATALQFKDNETVLAQMTGGTLDVGALSVTSTTTAISGTMSVGTAGAIRQGTGTWGTNFTGLSMHHTGGVGVLEGWNAGVKQAYFGSDGALVAGAGATRLDANGMTIDHSGTTSTDPTASLSNNIGFKSNAAVRGVIGTFSVIRNIDGTTTAASQPDQLQIWGIHPVYPLLLTSGSGDVLVDADLTVLDNMVVKGGADVAGAMDVVGILTAGQLKADNGITENINLLHEDGTTIVNLVFTNGILTNWSES